MKFIIAFFIGLIAYLSATAHAAQAPAPMALYDAAGTPILLTGGAIPVTGCGGGTVSSVGLSVPSWLSVTGSPVTSSGTLAVGASSQTANTFLAAPNGSSGAMSPRAIVAADLPSTTVSPGSYTNASLTVDQQGRVTAASSGAGGGGVSTIGTLDGATASANGAVISGSSLVMQSASGTSPGLVNTGAQTLAGAKTFSSAISLPAGSAATTSANFGTTGTGLYGSSTTVAAAIAGANVATLGASGLSLRTTTVDAALHVKNAGAAYNTGLVLESGGFTQKYLFDTESNSGGFAIEDKNGNPFFEYSLTTASSGFFSFGIQGPAYTFDFNTSDATTDPTAIVANSGATHTYPVLAIRNASNTAGALSCVGMTGVSKNLSGNICTVIDTQTAGSEVGHLTFLTKDAGTMGEKFRIGSKGQVSAGGTAPAVSSCGTSPSIVGNDHVGVITVGTGGTATACTLTFAATWTNIPHCFANDQTEIKVVQAVPTTTTVTFNVAAAYSAGSKIDYQCTGHF